MFVKVVLTSAYLTFDHIHVPQHKGFKVLHVSTSFNNVLCVTE